LSATTIPRSPGTSLSERSDLCRAVNSAFEIFLSGESPYLRNLFIRMVYIFAQGDKARSQQNEIGEVTGETFGKPILAINNLALRTASDGANDKDATIPRL